MSKSSKKLKSFSVENEKLYKVPEVLQVISDHAGVVLGEEEPEPYITPEEEASARAIFAQYDKDRSGRIEKGEMRAMLKDLELELDAEAFDKFAEASWTASDLDENGKIDASEFLLFYARVYAPSFKYGARLRKAVGRGETRLAREYIQRGCDPTGADGGGFTALHYAAQFGHVEPMELLAERREALLVDARDNSGWTPLMCAAANGHVPALRQLLELGANPNCQNDLGRTALHWAAARGREAVIKALAGTGADVKLVDKRGWTALHCAAMHGHLKPCAALIFDLDAPKDKGDKLGHPPTRYGDDMFWLQVNEDVERRKAADPKSKRGKK